MRKTLVFLLVVVVIIWSMSCSRMLGFWDWSWNKQDPEPAAPVSTNPYEQATHDAAAPAPDAAEKGVKTKTKISSGKGADGQAPEAEPKCRTEMVSDPVRGLVRVKKCD